MPTGKFKDVRSIRVSGEDATVHDIRNHLATSTCFHLGDVDADASLHVETLLTPPPGKLSLTLGDMDMVYIATLMDRKRVLLWKGAESTRQKMILGPGLHLPQGVNFYKEIRPLDAELLLLAHLWLVSCGPGISTAAQELEDNL